MTETPQGPDEQQYAPDVHLSLWEKIVGIFVLIFGFGRGKLG